MACNSEHMRHTDREAESGRVLEFLKEIAGQPFDHDNPSYYGNVQTLDNDTAALCAWCMQHDVTKQSLELQLWWQQHQKHDAKREAAEAAAADKRRAADAALTKLTDAERIALGFPRKE